MKYWIIETLISSSHAIGGTTYWYPIAINERGITKIMSRSEALDLFEQAKINYPPQSLRLIKITHCEIMSN